MVRIRSRSSALSFTRSHPQKWVSGQPFRKNDLNTTSATTFMKKSLPQFGNEKKPSGSLHPERRLLRGDKVQDLNVNRPGDQSPECGAACRNCRLHHAKHNLDPLQVSGRRAPISSRIPVTRVMRTAVPSNQATHPALTSQTSHAVFRAADRRSLHFLATWRKEGVQRPRGFGVHR